MKSFFLAVVFVSCFAPLAPGENNLSLQLLVSRLDEAAGKFHAMCAKIDRTKHTAVLNSDDTESGLVCMKKTGARVEGLMTIAKPDKKVSSFAGHEVQIYYPNMKEVDIYDTGKNGEQLEQFVTLGFGTPGTELEKTYTMSVKGEDTIKGEKTTHLELIPKSGEGKKLVKQVDLWIGEHNYPIQEKIFEPSGDYDLWTYSDVQINGDVKDQDVQLKLPGGVKKVYPQKP